MMSTQSDRATRPAQPKISARLGIAATMLTVFLVGCGESKVAQCNKLIAVVNKGQQISQSIKGMDAPAMKKLSGDLSGLSKEIGAVEVADESLKGFQGRFSKIYSDLSTASSKVGAALEEMEKTKKPTPDSLKRLKQLQEDVTSASKMGESAAKDESSLVKEVNTYCSAK